MNVGKADDCINCDQFLILAKKVQKKMQEREIPLWLWYWLKSERHA